MADRESTDRRQNVNDALASHPRRESLKIRDRLVAGVNTGITSQHGLIAHGRGEALDYLIGERTRDFALISIRAAVAMMLLADHPIISVNGNAAALVPSELVQLSEVTGAQLEINLFHHSDVRADAIEHHLVGHGAKRVLKPSSATVITGLQSDRRFVNPEGISTADVVFVPLEDGDRCGALRAMGKRVITVDLNPLSRTSRDASITIVDNVVRALPEMLLFRSSLATEPDRESLRSFVDCYAHTENLKRAEGALRDIV